MARILAVEWHEREARVAVGRARRGSFVVDDAFTVRLDLSDIESSWPSPEAAEHIGKQLAAALASRGLRRLEAVVAVDRNLVELRELSVPPAPDEELPDLVRFQAMRDFIALGDDWPLDFIPLEQQPGQPHQVLAAAINPSVVAAVTSVCEAAELKLHRLCIRPCAATSHVLRRQRASAPSVMLVIDLLEDAAGLTLVVDGRPRILRRAKLHGDPLAGGEAAEDLVSQVRRTIVAGQNELAGRSAEKAVLCGASEARCALAALLSERIGVPVEAFDPFEGLPLGSALRRRLPEAAGRFSAALGMLLDELQQEPPAIDFLHPRRRPEPVAERNTAVLAGAVAVLALLAFVLYGWYQERSLKDQINRLQAQSQQLDNQLQEASQFEKVVDEVKQWVDTDVVWLDELNWLAERFPDSKKAILTQLKLGIVGDRAEMAWEGLAEDYRALAELEARLQDPRHVVAGNNKSEAKSPDHYNYQFRAILSIRPPEATGLAKSQPHRPAGRRGNRGGTK